MSGDISVSAGQSPIKYGPAPQVTPFHPPSFPYEVEKTPENGPLGVVPRAPRGTGEAGKRLWRSVIEEFELSSHELEVLRELVAVTDVIATLGAEIDSKGAVLADGSANPLLVEQRQQRAIWLKLRAALRITGEVEE